MAHGTPAVRALWLLLSAFACSPSTKAPARDHSLRLVAQRLEPVAIVAVHAWDPAHVAIVAEGGFFAYSSDGESWTGASIPDFDVSELRGGTWPELWGRSANAVWHWAGPEHAWHRLDGLEDVQSLVALEGDEAVAAVRGAVVRFSDIARDRLATPGFDPERVAASSDGSTLVACGTVAPRGERTCRVGSTALLMPWRRFRTVEPASAPIEPWVSGDGELAAFAIPGSRVVRTAMTWLPETLMPMNIWIEEASCAWSKAPVGGMPTLLCRGGDLTSRFRLSRNGLLIGAPTPLHDFADDRPGGGWAASRNELVHYAHEGPDDTAQLVRSGADRRASVVRANGEIFVHASNDAAGRDVGVWNRKVFEWSEAEELWKEFGLDRWKAPTTARCSRSSEQCWIGGENLDLWRRDSADEPYARKKVESAGRGAITEIFELDGQLVALGESGTFLFSRDQGSTWKRHAVDARLRTAAVDDAGALWLGGGKGALFRWRDGRPQPEALKSGVADDIVAFATDGVGVLFATDRGGVSRSTDDGASWSRVLDPRETTTEVAFERRSNGNVVVAFANPDERYELAPAKALENR